MRKRYLSALPLIVGTGTLGAMEMTKSFINRSPNPSPETTDRDNEHWPEGYTDFRNEGIEYALKARKQSYEVIHITSKDGYDLSAYLFRTKENNGKVVVSCHGYHGWGLFDMARYLPMYEKAGLDTLIICQRAHEGSEGKYITFGAKEQEDVILWCNKLIELYGENVEIVLHGVSMGGATVCLASGNDNLPSQVKCTVSDCAYESMEKQAETSLNTPSFLIKPALSAISFWTKRLAGFSVRECAPIEAVKKARVPMLFIHGTADTFVPFEMADHIYDACTSEKEKLYIKGAVHAASYTTDPDTYTKTFLSFTERYL